MATLEPVEQLPGTNREAEGLAWALVLLTITAELKGPQVTRQGRLAPVVLLHESRGIAFERRKGKAAPNVWRRWNQWRLSNIECHGHLANIVSYQRWDQPDGPLGR